MNTTPVSNGRLIVLWGVALVVVPYSWIIVSQDLGAHSRPAALMAKGVSLGMVTLCAYALYRFRWLQFSVGMVSAIAGILGALGCAATLVLGLRGEMAHLAGRSIVGLVAFTLSSLFVAWAFLLSAAVRNCGKGLSRSAEHNAGSRPSSGDSPASEIPSSVGPRG